MNTLLKDARERLGLSAEEVAAKADVSAPTVYRAENNPHKINRNNLKRICSVLGLNIRDVLAQK